MESDKEIKFDREELKGMYLRESGRELTNANINAAEDYYHRREK